MFSSIFSSGDPKAPNFHPVTSETPPQELYGPLTPADLQWTCAGGFATETQIFYSFNKDGTFIMLQVIHASVGVWFPTIQFVVNVYNPTTKERIFSSTNVSNFSTAAGANDKISSKADEFSIIHNGKPTEPGVAESYTITARPSTELQVSVVVSRTADAAGWRLGRGPHGGRSWFGKTPTPDSADGYVVHRFWPRTAAKGHIVYKGKALDVDGPGMLVHAIQGMRPNLVASRWNFAHFQSEEAGGVSAIQMEFTTVNAYGAHGSGSGHVRVNIGSIVVGGKLVAVTGETRYPEGNAPAQQTAADKAKGDTVVSRAEHVTTARDADNGYMAPTKLAFTWRGPHIAQPNDTVEAHLEVDIGSPDNMNGLIEKVDILHQVPGAIKTIISAAAGLKPIIYQWLNPAELVITGKNLVPDQTGDKITVKGWVNNEATFISE